MYCCLVDHFACTLCLYTLLQLEIPVYRAEDRQHMLDINISSTGVVLSLIVVGATNVKDSAGLIITLKAILTFALISITVTITLVLAVIITGRLLLITIC